LKFLPFAFPSEAEAHNTEAVIASASEAIQSEHTAILDCFVASLLAMTSISWKERDANSEYRFSHPGNAHLGLSGPLPTASPLHISQSIN
jgi:hypothetical protein